MIAKVLQRPALVLNRNWQPVNVATVARALVLLWNESARVIDPASYQVYTWADWASMRPEEGEAFIHAVRIFGGQVGVTVMSRFIAEQEQVHSYLVGLHVQRGGWVAEHTVGLLSAGLSAQSSGAASAAGRAVGLVAGGVRLQAYSLTFIDAFHLIAWVSVATLILLATIRRFPLTFRDLAALDAAPLPARTSVPS